MRRPARCNTGSRRFSASPHWNGSARSRSGASTSWARWPMRPPNPKAKKLRSRACRLCCGTGSGGRRTARRARRCCRISLPSLRPCSARSRRRKMIRCLLCRTCSRGSRRGTPIIIRLRSGFCSIKTFRRRRLSSSEHIDAGTDFERWLVRQFAQTGAFTALVVLVEIGDTKVTPLCSTYFNVIGDEVDWNAILAMFAGSGMPWDGAAFFPTKEDGGALDNPTARLRLRELEQRIENDRLVLNEGHFFDKWGRRLKIDEVATQ